MSEFSGSNETLLNGDGASSEMTMPEPLDINRLLDEMVEKNNKEKHQRIERALEKKYYNIEQALDFLSNEIRPHCTVQTLANFVVRKALTPCFLYEGRLSRMCKADNNEPSFRNGDALFSGYVTPLERKDANTLTKLTAHHRAIVLKVRLVETIDMKEPIVEEFFNDEGDYLGIDYNHDFIAVDYYQVSADCNYEFSEQGVELYQSDCVFQESELSAILKAAQIKQKLSPETAVNNLELNHNLVEKNAELKTNNTNLENELDAAKYKLSEYITNPKERNAVAKMIGELVFIAFPEYAVAASTIRGLRTQGIIEKVKEATKISQETASKWIKEAISHTPDPENKQQERRATRVTRLALNTPTYNPPEN